MNTMTLKIDGMSCQHCVRSVSNALSALPGVKSVEVDLDKGQAVMAIDESAFNLETAEAAIIDAGYDLRGIV